MSIQFLVILVPPYSVDTSAQRIDGLIGRIATRRLQMNEIYLHNVTRPHDRNFIFWRVKCEVPFCKQNMSYQFFVVQCQSNFQSIVTPNIALSYNIDKLLACYFHYISAKHIRMPFYGLSDQAQCSGDGVS